MRREDDVLLTLTKRQLKGLLALALLAGAAYVMSESLTLSTSYPAPSGIYNKMITTADTYLSRDAGSVGVGTTNPGAKLEVAGNIIAAYPTADNHLTTKAYVDAAAGGGGKTWFKTSAAADGSHALALCTAAGAYHMCYPGEWIGRSWDTNLGQGDTGRNWGSAAWVDPHTNTGGICTYNSQVGYVCSFGADCNGWTSNAYWGCYSGICSGSTVILYKQMSFDITQYAVGQQIYQNNPYTYNSNQYYYVQPIIVNPMGGQNSNTAPYGSQYCNQPLPAMCCHN